MPDSPLVIKFNTPFKQAVEAANQRGVMLPADYYALPAAMRSREFTVSHIAKIDQIQAIFASLQKAQVSGISLGQWQKEIDYKQFGITKAHAETVFRNAMQTHYAIGHWESFQRTKKALPYLRYSAINDSRTSACCRALSGVIRRVDDPFWASHTPPNHHNCRSTLQALTESQAQKRSPAGEGFNKTESPDMNPQKGWDYNPAQSHDKMLGDLLEQKIANLPKASNWFKNTLREQAAKKLAQQAGMVESTIEKTIAEKTTMIDKKAFADFVEKVTAEDYKARHEFVRVGTLPNYVMADSSVTALESINNEIHVSDYQLRHAQRNEKSAPLPIEAVKKLPEKLENARWFFDSNLKNLTAVFDIESVIDEVGKAIVVVNFGRKKEIYNSVKTSGVIEISTLGMKNYREIKDEP